MASEKKDYLADLPDLPPLRTPSDMQSAQTSIPSVTEIDDFQELPSFPSSPSHNRFSQAAIKDAVSGDRQYQREEMQEWKPTKFERREPVSTNDELDEDYQERSNFAREVNRSRNSKPGPEVFVKIEKFFSAKKTVSEVKQKLDEIDSLINKVREIKLREEQELAAWEKELTEIKSRLKDVSEHIFEKVE